MKAFQKRSENLRFICDLAILVAMEIAIAAALGAVLCGIVCLIRPFL